MAYLIDTEALNIVITAVGEGFGQILGIVVKNLTANKLYTYDTVSHSWTPSAPQATPNDSMELDTTILNSGVMPDNIFGTFSCGQVTTVEPTTQTQITGTGNTFVPAWHFTMPAVNVNITISAGHEQ